MTNFIYAGLAINVVFFISLFALNSTSALSDWHREANWLLALLAIWVLGAFLFQRIGWTWLAAAMAWFTAILLPGLTLVGVFFIGWIAQTFKGPGAFR